MSYNGSGTFQINSSGQPVITGTIISSTAFNALTADLATGLSTAITKDGQTTTTVRVPFAAGISSTLVTDATSALTGSIITAGGISTQKALWVGTTSRLVGNTQHDGLVGIGMAPTNVLDITQSANANSIGRIFNGTSGTAGSAEWRASNNVNDSIRMISLNQSYTTSGLFVARRSVIASDGVGLAITTMSAQDMVFGINNAEVGRFNTGGHLCINTTTDQGHLNVGGALTSFSGGTANTASCVSMDFSGGVGRIQAYGANASTNGTWSIISCRSNGSNVHSVSIDTGGTVKFDQYGVGTATFDASGNISSVSDPSLKTRVGDFNSGLQDILAIAKDKKYMGKYRWNEDSGMDQICNYAGFFAYDDFPVTDAIAKNQNQINSFSDRPVIMALVNSIAELTARLEKLETV